MNQNIKKSIKQYISQIRLLLPLYTRNERIFLRDLRQTVKETAANNVTYTMEDITDLFGTPQDVVSEYMDALNQVELCQRVVKWKAVRRLLSLLIIVTLIAFGFRIEHHYQAYVKGVNSIVTEVEEVIE